MRKKQVPGTGGESCLFFVTLLQIQFKIGLANQPAPVYIS